MLSEEELNDGFSSDDEPEEHVILTEDNQGELSETPQATFDITEFIKTDDED